MTLLLGAFADGLTGTTDFANTLVRQGTRAVRLIGVPRPEPHAIDAVVVALKGGARLAHTHDFKVLSRPAPPRNQSLSRDPPSDMF